MGSLLQLPSETQDCVLILLDAEDMLCLRATCRAARIEFSKTKLLQARARCLRDRFAVIVRRFLAYRKVEKLLCDRTWWQYGDIATANGETLRNTNYHWQVLLSTQALVAHGFSARLPDQNPASILDHMERTTGMDEQRFSPDYLFQVLYAAQVG